MKVIKGDAKSKFNQPSAAPYSLNFGERWPRNGSSLHSCCFFMKSTWLYWLLVNQFFAILTDDTWLTSFNWCTLPELVRSHALYFGKYQWFRKAADNFFEHLDFQNDSATVRNSPTISSKFYFRCRQRQVRDDFPTVFFFSTLLHTVGTKVPLDSCYRHGSKLENCR